MPLFRYAAICGALACIGLAAAAAPQDDSTANALLQRADALVVIGSYDAAARVYREALAANPKLSVARRRLAHCLWRTGKTSEALQELDGLTGERGADVEALRLRADIHLDGKDYLRAAEVLEKLVAQRGTELQLKLQLADCYRRMAELGNPEARARALSLYNEVESSTGDPARRRQAMEAALTMRYGELGMQILAARDQITQGDAVAALQVLDGLGRQSKEELPYLHYLRGLALLSPGIDDRKAAMAALQRATSVPEATLQLGVLYYEAGQLDRASQQLQQAVKHDPRNQQAHYHLGLVHREDGDDRKAIAAWRRAVAIDANSAIGRWARTKLQVLSGRIRSLAPGQVIDPATEILIGKRTCERIEKRWPALHNERLQARLERIMERLIKHSDRPKRDLRFRIAMINVPVPNALTVPNGKLYIFSGLLDLIRTRLGDSDDAYAAVLAHEIAHNALRHGTGMIKMASTQSEYNSFWQLSRLMSALSRTHEYEADQYGALYAYRAGFDPAAAISLHQKVMQQQGEIPRGMSHPRHQERIARLRDYLLELRAKVTYFRKGVAAIAARDYDAAIDQLELFLGVFPDSTAARNNLAVALHRKALLNTDAAPVFRRSTDVDPDARIRQIRLRSTTQPRPNRRIHQRLLREAIAEYMLVLGKDSAYAVARNNLGAALADLGQLTRARDQLRQAIALRPRYAAAHGNLGVVHAELGNTRAAADSLRTALRLDSRYAAAHFNMALLQQRLGNKAAAASHWDHYVMLDSTSGWASIARARRAALR